MFAIYNTSGALVSIGTVIADPLPVGLTAIKLSPDDARRLRSGEYRWNPTTRLPEPDPAWTLAQQADTNRTNVEAAFVAALADLDAIIAAPAVGVVPDGTLTTAQLSNALRTMRDAVQANRAGAQQVATIVRNLTRYVRDDFTTV